MPRLWGLMSHGERTSQAPERSAGVSRMASRSTRSSRRTGEGSHFPRQQPSLREGAPMKPGLPPRQDREKENGHVANGADGFVSPGKGKAPSDRIMGLDLTEQEITARTEKPQFNVPVGRDTEAVPNGGPVGGYSAAGAAIPQSPIPSTSPQVEAPKQTKVEEEQPSTTEAQQKKPHSGMAATIAGGAAATMVAAAAAVGVHTGAEKETDEKELKRMEDDEDRTKEEEQQRIAAEERQRKQEEEDERKRQEEKEKEEQRMKEAERKEEEDMRSRDVQEMEEENRKKAEDTAVGGIAGGVLGGDMGTTSEHAVEEGQLMEPQPVVPEAHPTLDRAAVGQDTAVKSTGEAKGAEDATVSPQQEVSKSPEAGIIPGMFPTEPEQQPVSEAMEPKNTEEKDLISKSQEPTTATETAAGEGEGAGQSADSPAVTSGIPASGAAIVGGGISEAKAINAPSTSPTGAEAGQEAIDQTGPKPEAPATSAEESAVPSAMRTGAEQPTESAAKAAGGAENGGIGKTAAAGAAGIVGVAGGAGVAHKLGAENAGMGEEVKDGNKIAAEETEQRQLAEEQILQKQADEEAQVHERKIQEKREELERQKREEEELKEKQRQTEREIKEEEEAMEKEKERKKGLAKEEKEHKQVIGKQEKRREKEAKAREKSEVKERKKHEKQAKRRASSDVNGSKKGGLFGFLSRRMSSRTGGESGEPTRTISEGSKPTGKQPIKPEAETGTSNTIPEDKGQDTVAPEGKTNGPSLSEEQSKTQPLTSIGESSSTGQQGVAARNEPFPKLSNFPTARGGGSVSPIKTRTHSGPQFQANLPTYVTP